jgi:hypothetical protein
MAGNGNSRQLAVRYYANTSLFPTTGSEGVIYIDTSTDTMYLWDKTTGQYVKVADDTFEPRITNLEEKNETKQLFESISGTTSGSITTYTNINISQDNWSFQNNAFACELEAGRPSQKTLFTSAGVPITASINALGEYALSGTPTALNYCIVWLVSGKQVDFATAQIPENKIIEEYDYDPGLVRDNATGNIKPEIASDNLRMRTGGFLDDIRNTDILYVNRIEEKKQQQITVAKDGGDFTTIQGAIDSITDASVNKPYLIKIYPGTYTEDVVNKDYINFEGAGLTLTTLDGTLVLGANFECRKMRIRTTITTSKTILDGATNTGGALSFNDFSLEVSTSTVGVKPIMLCVDASSLYLENFSLFYTNTSGGVIGSDTDLVDLRTNGTYIASQSAFVVVSNQSSGNLNVVKDNNSGITSSTSLIANIFMTNASWNDIVSFIRQTNNSSNKHIISNSEITVIGAGLGDSKIMNNDSGGALSAIESCRFESLNFTNRCVINAENVGDEVDFTFSVINEELTDAEAFCGSGTINRVYRDNGNLVVNTDIIDLGTLIGTPTNDSMQDMFDIGFNAGWVSGQAITDNLDGTVSITAGTGYIRTSNDEQAPLKSFDIIAFNNISLTDESDNYIYVDYNSGSPTVLVTTSSSTILDNENDKYEIYEVYREGTDLHITDHKQRAKNVPSRVQQRIYSINKIERANSVGGLLLSESADTNRNVLLSAGLLWVKLNPITITAIDTSGSDTFDRYYLTGGTTWNKTTGNTTWDNTQYNDTTTGLVEMTVNRYSFQDFWLDADNDLVSVYGTAQYVSLAGASDAPVVSAPPRTDDHALYVGRIVFRKSDTTAQAVLTPFGDILFTSSVVSVHNNLSGLQGGLSGEYYHLDSQDYTDLSGNSQLAELQPTGDPIFNSSVIGSLSFEDSTITEFSLNILTLDVLDDLDDSTLKIVNTGGGGVCRVGINETSPETTQEITHTEPYITLHNSTHEDIDGGRECRLIGKGEQSGGEESELGYYQFSHDGTSDDEKGKISEYLNNGSSTALVRNITSQGEQTLPLNTLFNTYRSGNLSNVVGGGATYTVPFNAEIKDIGSNFNSSTGIFTAPVDGNYSFSATVNMSDIDSTNTDCYISIRTSNKEYRGQRINLFAIKGSSGNCAMSHAEECVDMEAGDTAYITITCVGNATVDITGVTQVTHFKGRLEQ